MKARHLLALSFFFHGYQLWAESRGPCINTEKGRPVFIDSKMICTVQQSLDSSNSPDLAQKTMGIVQRMELTTDLGFGTRPASNIGSSELTLALSPITAKGKVFLAGKDEALEINLTFAPKIQLAGNSVCDLKFKEITLGVSHVDVAMPGWVRTALKNILNQNLAMQDKVKEALSDSLAGIQGTSCDSERAVSHNETIIPDSRWDAIASKRDLYLSLNSDNVDSRGWILDTHCDGLLYNSLYNISGGKADIDAVELLDQPGRLDRHWMHDCYKKTPNEQGLYSNSSTISRDMMNGFSLYSLWSGNPELIKRVVAYGEQHAFEGFPLIWIVGDGDIGRVDMPPSSVTNLYRVREKLTGIPSPYPDFRGQVFGHCKGYECHLQVLSIIFDYKANGYISKSAQDYLQRLADRLPENALFNIAFGKIARSNRYIDRGVNTLLNEQYFPSDRLPNNRDRCDEYLFSREMYNANGGYSHDWIPCPERKFQEFSGVDLLFTTAILFSL